MIEVNLLPGGKKRPGKGGGFRIGLPDLKAFPADPFIIGAVVVGLASATLVGWWYTELNDRDEELVVALEDAIQDSVDFSDLIENNNTLQARQDSVAQKVDIIQEIDAGRYVWPHVLDEVARALPDFLWITALRQVTVGDFVEFRLDGRAGNNIAVTTFMDALEASPFVRGVRLISTEQALEPLPNGDDQIVIVFTIEAAYEQPAFDLLETVPLFGEGADSGS
ncbi:MAG: PilN domain-containing protein [Longimicrobiales bacterium]